MRRYVAELSGSTGFAPENGGSLLKVWPLKSHLLSVIVDPKNNVLRCTVKQIL